jgi:UDP-2,3-diacylglucosamine hydrolase
MELQAPSSWQCTEFVSDLHLHAQDRPTFAAWAAYLQTTRADAVFILGDLFEVWVGDDAALVAGSFEAECVGVLRQAAQHRALYLMHGNRDFLMGPALMQACAATALEDPTLFSFGRQRWLLSHGDALCLGDHAYQAFRSQVRSGAWQQAFLAKPLSERQAIARGMRQSSEARKQSQVAYADVDAQAANALLEEHRARHMIHGHTHKPAQHALANGNLRTVLSDWDVQATPPRAEVLRLSLDGHGVATMQRIALAA